MGCITCGLEKLGHGSCGERDEGIPCGILLYLYAYNIDTDASLLEVDYAHKQALILLRARGMKVLCEVQDPCSAAAETGD